MTATVNKDVESAHAEAAVRPSAVRRQFKILLLVSVAAGAMTLQFAPEVAAEQTPVSALSSRVALVPNEIRPPRILASATPTPVLALLRTATTTTTTTTTTVVTTLAPMHSATKLERDVATSDVDSELASSPGPSTLWANNSLWSGYVARAPRFTGVSGDWTVPTVTCNSPIGAWASQWIGIGGYHDPRLIQIGTDTDCLAGQPTYYSWYEIHSVANDATGFSEIVPAATQFPLSAGDHMHASISLAASGVVVLSDLTAGWTFTTAVHSKVDFGAAGSVEWITEDEPGADGVSQGLLPKFAPVQFSNANATAPGRSGTLVNFSRIGLNLFYNGHRLDVTSSLDASGASFSERWVAAI